MFFPEFDSWFKNNANFLKKDENCLVEVGICQLIIRNEFEVDYKQINNEEKHDTYLAIIGPERIDQQPASLSWCCKYY